MFCEACGRKIEKEDRFCPDCGAKIETGTEETVYLGNEAIESEMAGTESIAPPFEPKANIVLQNPVSKEAKWPARLLTGLLIAAILVLGINIAVGILYLKQIKENDKNYELPELHITETDDSVI